MKDFMDFGLYHIVNNQLGQGRRQVVKFKNGFWYESTETVRLTQRHQFIEKMKKGRFSGLIHLRLSLFVDYIVHRPSQTQTFASNLQEKTLIDLIKWTRNTFHKMISRYQPSYWIHGHTHRSYGMAHRWKQIGNTVIGDAFEYLEFEIETSGEASS